MWACFSPTSAELADFFEGSENWTEVESASSFQLASNRPVRLQIDFKDSKNTQIRWGDHLIKGDEISLCWTSRKKNKIQIRRRFFKTTLVKVKTGLLKSWIPIDGDLYYRKDTEVQKSEKPQKLADTTY